MTKLRAQVEGLSVPATVATANLPKDTLVAVTADRTVDKAGANALVVGRLFKPARKANDSGTVETRFKELVEIKASGAVAAGQEVKLAAPDPVTGENRAAVFDPAADTVTRRYGMCWAGGADGATLEVLTY
ncbi:MAG TPA: hypothetical protein VIP46_22670 [Pyrinomonadaceae bacterium]